LDCSGAEQQITWISSTHSSTERVYIWYWLFSGSISNFRDILSFCLLLQALLIFLKI